MTRTKLYLDVDGVLNADFARANWSDTKKFKANVYPMTVSMELVEQLTNLVAKYDLELVWLTTWNADNDVLTYVVPQLEGFLTGGRILSTPGVLEPIGWSSQVGWSNGENWKVEALLLDQKENPSDFVWIDDWEVPIHREGVQMLLGETRNMFLLGPNAEYGVTPTQVADLDNFLFSIQDS